MFYVRSKILKHSNDNDSYRIILFVVICFGVVVWENDKCVLCGRLLKFKVAVLRIRRLDYHIMNDILYFCMMVKKKYEDLFHKEQS